MSESQLPVTLRLLTEHDLPMLHDWLNRPHIVEWWGGEAKRPSLGEVLEDYRPDVLAEASVTPYIAMLGDEPIGYAQSYVALGSGDGWWEDETDPGVRGIDQSLADPTRLDRGLGMQLVRALVERLFADPAVTKIQTDPAPDNHRAIRCYEKAGFVRQAIVTTPDGPAVYMVQTRRAFERERHERVASCSCGQLGLRTVGEPLRVSICHCLACQRRTGSVFGAQARFRRDAVQIKGKSSVYARVGDEGGRAEFHFCPRCGATVHYAIDASPEHVVVPVGAFAEPGFPAPSFSVFEERMHGWIGLPDGIEHLA